MTPKKELQLAYGMAIVLLVVGLISYAAFPAKSPEQPIRMMFKCAAGKVLFDHKTHTDSSGYGIACSDCHHHPADDPSLKACGDCHLKEEASKAPQLCMECHEPDDGMGDQVPMMRADSFHKQCVGCHEAGGAGPVECGKCHVTKSVY
ncbi:MAG: cytochrome c3 family protein [Desulfobacterales bacterium]|nr:cytochrome c3 family protein [Desulfobacterales bacterium]MDD4071319.1 cytochrome c3 family protein [Desulfobacterales bacterium]MDD4392997.1 cytochrome c3 family protein [Desulfobacterales bacterium]